MMRAQQAVAAGGAQAYLPPEHFDQIFLAHGTIMIFFIAMPFFFFQAEDGIRVFHVTGVQTCALPIFTVTSIGFPISPVASAFFSNEAIADLASGEVTSFAWNAITAGAGPPGNFCSIC